MQNKRTIRINVTVTGHYEADLDDYQGETDPAAMAAIDADNIEDDAVQAVLLMDEKTINIVVEPA